ncbi:small integral membrane protein 15-like [Eptesicus fuscus]|uniref:small integral membrane protein 15-like n=1 Tax=Eptesicus fuscus TaxID=29078 RepID=UPI0024041CE3|nr:small integral membrane protein 15-like [Eptesicus fuscus]
MWDRKAWAGSAAERAAKDPGGFLTAVISALTPLFLASAVLAWKLAKVIEARGKGAKKKQNKKRQENIAKTKRLQKDCRNEQAPQPEETHLGNYAALEGPCKVSFLDL